MLSRLFPANLHPMERALRIVLGLVIFSLVFVGPRTPWGYAGAIFLITGLAGDCPLYTLFGWSTCPLKTNPTRN